ncbi:MAG: hypothetical protein M0033_00415 [Nitrospiraceae bacterium]|nr:hypothetical protein [Nitrospiraceae bacterium]
MKMKALAEAIILQSFEDLWDKVHRNESLEFFKGGGFDFYAGVAGLGPEGKLKLLDMFKTHLAEESRTKSEKEETLTGGLK